MSTNVLGWSAAMNKWRDPTGIAHLQVLRAGFAFNACGASSMTFGMTHDSAREAGAHPCRRCLVIEQRKDPVCPS